MAPVGFAAPSLASPDGTAAPMATPGATGYTPAQIRDAYGFNQISFDNGTVAADGQGTTIAIVDAYSNPDIATDLQQFDAAFDLPNPTFTVVNQTGGPALPAANAGWATEIALDVEWAHAVAPAANILLVEANSNSFNDLFTAVNYARNAPGVVAVSMSWGGSEYAGETAADRLFTTPAGHTGVTFLTSAGDTGAPIGYPGASPNVVSVGGTALDTANGSYDSESAWTGSGGGISLYELQPGYQRGLVTQTTSMRTDPDVSYDADPDTGFPVYDLYDNSASDPWAQWGGTSDAAPQWAGLIAVADQGRELAGLGSLDGATQTLPMLYALPASAFHDITTGTTDGTPSYSAGPGYDLATGRGSPNADVVVNDLVGTAPTATRFAVSAPAATTAGNPVLITVTALDSAGAVVTGYNGTVSFTSSDGSAALPGSYTFTSADQGRHTFTVELKTAGAQTVTVTGANGTVLGTATIDTSPAAPARLVFLRDPGNSSPTELLGPAPIVEVLDAYGNVVTNDNTNRVTLSLDANAGGGSLIGMTTLTVQSGVATFNALSVLQPGAGYSLLASAPGLGSAVSSTFSVSAFGLFLPSTFSLGSAEMRVTAATLASVPVTVPSVPKDAKLSS